MNTVRLTRVYLLFFVQLFWLPLIAQPTTQKIAKTKLPTAIKYKGKLISALQWKDNTGDNILVLSETGDYQSATDIKEDSRSAELYANHYLLNRDSALLNWKLLDFERGCPVDVLARFLSKDPWVTDLDKDGTAEIWLVYQTACRGDVSPATMKIIMYEGKEKHAMKGSRKIQVGPKEFVGGEYTFDSAFRESIPAFITYARQLWKKYVAEPL